MDIAQNMSFALRLAKVNKAEIDKRVLRVAKILHIDHLLGRRPAELSGGQRQRVAMGRAMVRDASTFLFDEPLSNLDAKLRARMRTELAEMRNQIDKNMIYVTHDQVEAMTLGDRIVVMSDGVIQQQGTPEKLYKSPRNRFVAGFIGSPAMNFMDGEITEKSGKLWVRGDGYALPVTANAKKRFASHPTRQVTVGLRPSSISMAAKDGALIELRIVVSEYLGAHSVLATRCGSNDLLVEIASAAPVRHNEMRKFKVNTDEMMIFDRETGLCL